VERGPRPARGGRVLPGDAGAAGAAAGGGGIGAVLIGYDTESAAVGEGLARFPHVVDSPYRFALEPETTARALAILEDVHRDVGVAGTLFVCGRTLLHALDAVRAAKATGLFDVQQHTYSHVPFREIEYSPEPGATARIAETPAVALREELVWTSRLIAEHLGHECVGIRTPFGYYRGLRDRPDLLAILREAGIRYTTSWGRNERNDNPTPWVQPFAYEEEGYPNILELPFQFWLDVVWFDRHGYDTGPALLEALRGAVDEVAERDLVYGACFHEWVMLASDEERVGWLRGFLEYALERGVEITTYTDYWRRVTSAG
jgi:peptidoglycan/xylan/chitin deacetylase (PgdA/CDA1 family)